MHDIFKKYNPSSVSSSIKRKSDLRINIYHVTFKIDGLKLLLFELNIKMRTRIILMLITLSN